MLNRDVKIPQMEEFVENMKNPKPMADDIKIEFLGRVVTIVIAGLGLITVLAWDETLKDLYEQFFSHITNVSQKLGYAVFVTIFSVLVSIIIGRIFIKKKRKVKQEIELLN